MKIYDCFMFYNEIDILKIRLEELYNSVNYFVIIEATTTHTEQPKELNFQKNIKEFSKWMDKIIYIPINNKKLNWFDKLWSHLEKKTRKNFFVKFGMLFGFGNWKLDTHQRNQIKIGLTNCADDDIILVSDVDEIPNKKVLNEVKSLCIQDFVVGFKQKMYIYFLNGESNEDWVGTKAISYKNLRRYYSTNSTSLRYGFSYAFRKRILKTPTIKLIDNAGWHFSYLGDVKSIMNKLNSIVHTENSNLDINNSDKIKNAIQEGSVPWNPNIKIRYVEIDNSFPSVIRNNKNKYKELIR